MKTYRIKKIAINYEYSQSAEMSTFGYSKEYFEGKSLTSPMIGDRFELFGTLGDTVISTSPVTEILDGKFKTCYSVYSIQEL